LQRWAAAGNSSSGLAYRGLLLADSISTTSAAGMSWRPSPVVGPLSQLGLATAPLAGALPTAGLPAAGWLGAPSLLAAASRSPLTLLALLLLAGGGGAAAADVGSCFC
jgi:hypothetical protein